MCFSKKKKDKPPTEDGQGRPEGVSGSRLAGSRQDASRVGGSRVGGSKVGGSKLASTIPQSKVAFGASDYEPSPLPNQKDFVATKRVDAFNEDLKDREEDYAREVGNAHQSKLIQPL